MDIWSVLKINKTKDKNIIKEAYIEKVSKVNPEDDPEGFKILRAAYEEAIEYSKSDEIEVSNDPIEVWGRKIQDVYNTFSKRIDENSWIELFEDEVSYALDTKDEALNKLLEFLMDYYFIPCTVWNVIDIAFNIQERQQELSEKFPYDFIDFLINKIKYDDPLRYDLFEIDDSKDYESWLNLYYKIKRDLDNNELEIAREDLLEIKELEIYNPYLDLLESRYLLLSNKANEAEIICKKLINQYPDNGSMVYFMAEVYWALKKYDEAEKYYLKCLELIPNDYNCKLGLADVAFEKGEIERAKESFTELLTINFYDDYVRNRVYEVNEMLINKYKKKVRSKEITVKDGINTAWCYFENFKYEDAIQTVVSLQPEGDKEIWQCYDIVGSSYYSMKKFEESYKYYNLWLSGELEEIQEDADEKDRKRIAYLYGKIGRISYNLKEYKEAINNYNKAISYDNSDEFYLQCKCEALNKLGRYEEALAISEKALELDSNDAFVYINRSESLYNLGYFNDAMECCNDAINIYPYYSEPYLIQMKIFNIYDEFDEMINISKVVEELEIESNEILLYKSMALRRLNRLNEAEKLNLKLLSKLDDSSDDSLKSMLNYELTYLEIGKENFVKALEYINLAIKHDDNIDNYYLRAYIYRNIEEYNLALADYEETIKKDGNKEFSYYQCGCICEDLNEYNDAVYYYKKVLENNPEHMQANSKISKAYEKLNDDENAIKYITNHLEINPTANGYIHRGLIYERLGECEKSFNDYNTALEIEPNNPYAYNNIGYEYQKKGLFEKAINNYKKAIKLSGDIDFVNPYTNIAETYFKINNIDKALEYCDEGINKMPSEECFYYKKAIILKKISGYNEAIEVLLKGLQLEDLDKEKYYKEIADIYYLLKDYDESEKWNKKLIELEGKNA